MSEVAGQHPGAERAALHVLLGDLAVMDWPSLEAGLAAIARTTADAIGA